ncbi:hypothetical protein DICPUDRAFT_151272 [Dictyostelium purpureum]|uniref:GPR180/TMEM145 transmembrane domain-containing protein n=1 Tax=Dictyostelium purpureum TaxID=5786 RepID=F0ZIF4_DICPU|nr:uncharacterized protein DICPUDRAFT_151272 [Dictyostelium purpureum]EGC36250.1 hypothetical protein DICPUDRAFT_151272 [Dictyostelium purpureum]|eukprot:XP_003287196.1 hypothetical protein DICPUDRAFT_151272 [Dictyostelium purpureum]
MKLRIIKILLVFKILFVAIGNGEIIKEYRSSLYGFKDGDMDRAERVCFDHGGGFELSYIDSNSINSEILIYTQENYESLNKSASCNEKKLQSSFIMSNKKNSDSLRYQLDLYYSEEINEKCFYVEPVDCNPIFTIQNTDKLEFYYSLDIYDYKDDPTYSPVPEFVVFFLISFLVLLIVSVYQLFNLKTQKLESRQVTILSLAILFWFLSLASLVSIFRIFKIAGNSIFTCLLLLLSQGWTKSPNYGTTCGKIVNAGLIIVLVALGWTIHIINHYNDFITQLFSNPYQSPVGYVLIVVYYLIVVYFIVGGGRFNTRSQRQLDGSVVQMDSRLHGYTVQLKVVFSVWIISIPLISSFSLGVHNDFHRFVIVTLASYIINLTFILVFLYFYHPCKHNYAVQPIGFFLMK